LIGPAPGILGGYPGQSFIYRAAAQAGAPVGATVSAALPVGPRQNGVAVPRSAVVWRHGRAMVFRTEAGRRFERVAIATGSPTPSGYFVSDGLSAGDRVVVRGAALLSNGGANTGPADRDD
ncbi:MAG: hypothetical protein WB710_02815, partial [Stellaceae bacterium]